MTALLAILTKAFGKKAAIVMLPIARDIIATAAIAGAGKLLKVLTERLSRFEDMRKAKYGDLTPEEYNVRVTTNIDNSGSRNKRKGKDENRTKRSTELIKE